MTDEYIPVNPGDLPIEGVTLEESEVYNVEFKKAAVSPKLSKRGVPFCMLQFEIVDGDYEGVTVSMNYMPLPLVVAPDAKKRDQVQAHERSWQFGRFAKAFGIPKSEAFAMTMLTAQSMAEWHEKIQEHYGNRGKITIQNQEFPAGSGRKRSGVNDFIF